MIHLHNCYSALSSVACVVHMLNLHPCKNASSVGNSTVELLYMLPVPHSRMLFIASPTCVSCFFFFRHQAIDVLFLQCQFAPSLLSWLPSNGPRDLIDQGYAFGHTDCDSQLVNEFNLFAGAGSRIVDSSLCSFIPHVHPAFDPKG